MDPRRRSIDVSLLLVQLVGLATLVRSIAFDRWITVLASVLLLVGATAGRRGKAWGIAGTLGTAAAFPVAYLIGIAPPWFCVVGAFGALPFLLASRAFLRFDKAATAILATAAVGTGAAAALAWREYAWSVFTELPIFRPSVYPHHGFALLTITAAAVIAMRLGRRRPAEDGALEAREARYRIAEPSHVRVTDAARAEEEALAELDDELDAERPYARRAR